MLHRNLISYKRGEPSLKTVIYSFFFNDPYKVCSSVPLIAKHEARNL